MYGELELVVLTVKPVRGGLGHPCSRLAKCFVNLTGSVQTPFALSCVFRVPGGMACVCAACLVYKPGSRVFILWPVL